MNRQVTFLCALTLSIAACAVNEKSSSAEWIAEDGRIAAYGNIEPSGVCIWWRSDLTC